VIVTMRKRVVYARCCAMHSSVLKWQPANYPSLFRILFISRGQR